MSESDFHGHFIGLGSCYVCHGRFVFNPDNVVCFDGHPVCRPCVVEANEILRERDETPIWIPADAYPGNNEEAP